MQIQQSPSFPFKKIGQTTDTPKERKLKEACQNFEAIIIQQMLTAMRKTVPKDGLFTSGYAEDMYQSMYDEGLSKEIASGRGLGLADVLYKQLSGGITPPTK
ncbi:MAG: rod-binding protein [Desulfobulbaceae bacterium]|nr:rod-binding protein [Desulfobulbaceae bacterium]